MAQAVVGQCHICKLSREIEFCGLCGHWFCWSCRNAWWWRGWEAVKQLLVGAKPGCCGPEMER